MRQRILAAIFLGVLATTSQAASFLRLQPGLYSDARAISADGKVVVGNTLGDSFRWTAATGLVNLNAGFTSMATGVSGDGSIVVGTDPSSFSDGNHFFRWTSTTGVQYIGRGDAEDISADGTTIVGTQFNRAFRWTNATGLTQILPAGSSSTALAVSADGSVIAGSGTIGPNTYPTAGRWTAETGWINLGLLPGGSSRAFPVSAASAVSAGGDVLGGFSTSAAFGEETAFRWTQSGGMVQLDTLPGNHSSRNVIRGISADGSIMVGEADKAFIWTATGGNQDLLQFLVAHGATGLDGWNLWKIGGITPDGRFITGSGTSPQGNLESWIVDIAPVPLPAAAWLFGGALGALGVLRRKALT